jgi:formylmethanofuran dehydrogenase subunit C
MSGGRITILRCVATLLPSFYTYRVVKSTKLAPEKVKIKGPFYLFLGDVIANIQCGGRLYASLG